MDLNLYVRVMWRFRWLVLGGTVLAVALAFFSYASVSFKGGSPKLTYRQSPTWENQESVLITQHGFPWGRTVLPTPAPGAAVTPANSTFADPNRLIQLAVVYSQLANSDAVQRAVLTGLPTKAKMTAMADTIPGGIGTTLPFVQITGIGTTQAMATEIAMRGGQILSQYITNQQIAANIPANQRVVVQITTTPKVAKAQLLQGRKKTIPIVILLTVLIATFGLAFMLENLRPAVRVPAHASTTDELTAPASTAA